MLSRMNGVRLRLCCLMLAVLIAAGSLCGCTLSCSCSSAPFERVIPPPTISYTDIGCCRMPYAFGCDNADTLNQALTEYFSPLIDLLAAANVDTRYLDIECDVSGKNSRYTLHPRLVGRAGGCIELPDIAFNSISGSVSYSDADLPGFLSDGDFTAGYLHLRDLGIEIDLGSLDSSMQLSELYSLLTEYYEKVTGLAIDTSRFTDEIIADDSLKRPIAIGLTSNDTQALAFSISSGATCYELADAMCGLCTTLSAELSGNSSNNVFRSDVMELTDIFMRCYYDDPGMTDRWKDIVDTVHTVSAADIAGIPQFGLTRQSFATMYTYLYELLFGTISDTSAHLDDTDDIDCRKCMSLGIMSDCPSSGLFSPEYYTHMCELPALCRDFAWASYVRYLDNTGYSSDIDCHMREVIARLGDVGWFYPASAAPKSERVCVINDPGFDFYINQYDTGDYSNVNCMPTISAMGIQWYLGQDCGVTPQSLRDYYLDESDSGWYMSQVLDALELYEIPYTRIDIESNTSARSLTDELDKGHIILTQMSEAEMGVSGHCFVIFGYKRYGDSIRFIVHDPGISSEYDTFGRFPGDSEWLDSSYVCWVMDRIAFYYVSLGD